MARPFQCHRWIGRVADLEMEPADAELKLLVDTMHVVDVPG